MDHALAVEAKGAWAFAVLDAHLVGTTGFVAVARAVHQHLRHRSQGGDGFDWLLGLTFFAGTDGVLDGQIDHIELTKG